MSDGILTEIDAGVGLVTLDRPDRHNAFDDALIRSLTAAFSAMERDSSVRVVVLGSRGGSFCAGADLNWMKRAAGYGPEETRRDTLDLAAMLRAACEMSKPVVARVQGPAYGGGVGLIAACDIAIATYDAQFALSEVKLGIIPAVISPYVIGAIGARRARRYMLTAERFSAAEAYRIGLVHEIVPGEAELDEALGEIVDALLGNGPAALGECKALIRAVENRPVGDELVEETAERIGRVRASAEAREGMAAFLEKRKPSWLRGQ
ncbi:MAG TPA: enoyl-CoA hydratase [Rhodocyclaceae bacterium]|nr:MAG: enoyl-CoA hydratase [Betaproteobacteria bacterium CG2_30_68_42]PIX76244.1 MAG: enoyl-CoA hydratase [Rhodocyclales bacterium CG_4_10_14_3_um_filter_68_10]PJA56186.1 MAG: enoyl-CoA hydratase [Rhodocyclales bacterium CG_4_9_14_3_um_filter_68_10]HCX32132.1 enoyl-CoA hydratase [Rhodocyclaceae bacterium]